MSSKSQSQSPTLCVVEPIRAPTLCVVEPIRAPTLCVVEPIRAPTKPLSAKDAKKARKAEKEAKAVAMMRTKEERESEVATLRGKIQTVGFPDECPGMIEVERLFSSYIEHGDTVVGKASFREWDRVAEIVLPARRDRDVTICLRYVGQK